MNADAARAWIVSSAINFILIRSSVINNSQSCEKWKSDAAREEGHTEMGEKNWEPSSCVIRDLSLLIFAML